MAIKYYYSVPESAEPVEGELIAMKEDPESRAELKRRMDRWNTLSPDFILKKIGAGQ